MPELPEVETVVRTLAPRVLGRRIAALKYLSVRARSGQPEPEGLSGQRVRGLRRLGKHILFDLDRGVLDVHLRMTGKLLADAEPGPYARAVLELEDGRVVFDDVRQFGYMVWRTADPELGRDALAIGTDEFVDRLARRRGSIKAALLDQGLVAGLGNIYVDEALFRAGIHPKARSLSKARLLRLHAAIVKLLGEAIEAGGSSISDYVDAQGRHGSFQERHQVYGREGKPCVRCGAPIRRITLGQRGTHFCPRCQRR